MKKLFSILFIIIILKQPAYAQDSCYNCNIDSLALVLKTAKTDAKKIVLYTLLIDMRLLRINVKSLANNILTDSLSKSYLDSLIQLSNSQKVKDINAYQYISDAFNFIDKKDFLNARDALIKSIALFDVDHKRIPNLLWFVRFMYNEAGNQEDRYKFFTDKLKYYLTNGPVENVAACYHGLAGYYVYKADYNLAISNYLKAAAIYKNFSPKNYRSDLTVIATEYGYWGNYQKAVEYYKQVLPLIKIARDSLELANTYREMAFTDLSLGKYPETLRFLDTSFLFQTRTLFSNQLFLLKAFALMGMYKPNDALINLNYAKKIADSIHTKIFSAAGSFELDYGYYQYYSAIKKYEEAGNYLLMAYQKAIEEKSNELQLKYLKELSLFYGQQHNSTQAFYYTRKFYDLTDELNRGRSSFKVAQYENEQKEIAQNESINALKQERAIQAATIKKNSTILWGSLVALILISISLVLVYRQYHLNKKILLSLRKTQRQLIMSEKMASLGELTAGIAHEIQNPLNFVNNFSEVNNELINEMVDEVDKGNTEEVKAIANDIKQNLEKINHHGKRADAIVKGMLQHSRATSSQKESTDINSLADEYLRLSYHGLRAKDKSFNATLQTDFDTSIEKINVVPQDIGRVLLNLYNNAFYAVSEKNASTSSAGQQYEPKVSISTKKLNGKVEICVKDNGNGIPQKVIDKIFQPFFTTKPPGQGTGLGLSLSYDIIKAHGGEIKVEMKEGKGADFVISVPENEKSYQP